MSNHDDESWYIRYEFDAGDGLTYNFQSDYKVTPEDAFYNLLHKINASGVKL